MSFKRGWKLSDLFYLSSFMSNCISFEKENKKNWKKIQGKNHEEF